VLFYGQSRFEQAFLAALDEAPPGEAMVMVEAALGNAAELFPEERRTWSRARQQIIDADVAFQERELLKMSSLSAALTGALAGRGIDPVTAALAAESGVTVFRTAFLTWIAEGEQRTFADIQSEVLKKLYALTGGR
jgi:hypothetical protein